MSIGLLVPCTTDQLYVHGLPRRRIQSKWTSLEFQRPDNLSYLAPPPPKRDPNLEAELLSTGSALSVALEPLDKLPMELSRLESPEDRPPRPDSPLAPLDDAPPPNKDDKLDELPVLEESVPALEASVPVDPVVEDADAPVELPAA